MTLSLSPFFSWQVIEIQHRRMEHLGSQIQVIDHLCSLKMTSLSYCCLLTSCSRFPLQALEVQISQEENASQALREDVLAKEQNMDELHMAMKKVLASCILNRFFYRLQKMHLLGPS